MVISAFIALLLLSCFLLSIAWSRTIGVLRGSASGICRLAWTFPLVLCLFPKIATEELPRVISSQTIHILLDDSESMNRWTGFHSPIQTAEKKIDSIREQCRSIGCNVKVSKLSELNQLTAKGYTPLSETFISWKQKIKQDAWVLFSDGGDFQPNIAWNSFGSSLRHETKKNGLIVGFGKERSQNVWIEDVELAPFAFEGKSVVSHISLKKSQYSDAIKRVQVHAKLGDQILSSKNIDFHGADELATISLSIPSLARGRHFVSFEVLASADESILWDNQVHRHVEVMPNTVGVLHLLGSPSWDGRFLRRFLKAEPKYDLISFFILRDPWDSQVSNERELSLIPFPVSRLFNEELPNFRVIILQNFTLLQFLLPQYQKNLVSFVKNGGGLLFLGGYRALKDADLRNSPLKEILPFSTTTKGKSSLPQRFYANRMGMTQAQDKSGPWFDPKLKFKIQLAKPNMQKRSLANIYDDWEGLGSILEGMQNAQGIHHMENVTLRDESYTPLLYAQTEKGTLPLAMATYPGKGRAIWIFSDSMWRLALTPKKDTPREAYDEFMQSTMTWLLRQNLRRPLIVSSFTIKRGSSKRMDWVATLQGPAVPYFSSSQDWMVSVCDSLLSNDEINIDKLGNQQLLLSGSIIGKLTGGERCEFSIKGQNAAFGSVVSSSAAIVPQLFKDAEISPAPQKLAQLAGLVGADFQSNEDLSVSYLNRWLDKKNKQEGLILPKRFKSFKDYYWALKEWWLILCLFFLPLEIVIRKWHDLSTV